MNRKLREDSMGSQEVKLLGNWASPFAYRIKWTLKLKGIEYEYLEEDDLSNKSSLLLECNPVYKKVPVLIHGGKPISESLIILEYIDETWNQKALLPKDTYEKAMVRFWAKFIEEKLTEVLRRALITEGEELEEAMRKTEEALTMIDGELKNKKGFFGGAETIGYLDIVLGFTVVWLEAIEEVACVKVFDSHKYPFLSKWMGKMREFSIIKDDLPPKKELLNHFQKVRKYVLALKAK